MVTTVYGSITITNIVDGKSAYEIWLEQGNIGTEEDYLASLKGDQGRGIVDETILYYAVQSTNGKPTTPATPDVQPESANYWVDKMPLQWAGNNTYIFKTTKQEWSDGDTTYTTPILMSQLEAATIAALDSNMSIAEWCVANNVTIIDGSTIATGTITADQIDVNSLVVHKDFTVSIQETVDKSIGDIGGRNLASLDSIVHQATVNTNDGHSWNLTKNDSYSGTYINSSIFEEGKTYTLSFCFQKTGGTLINIGGHTGRHIILNQYIDGEPVSGSYYSGFNLLDNDSKHHVVLTFTARKDADNNHVYIQPNRTLATPVTYDLWDIKVEAGSYATGWAPAPEDMATNEKLSSTLKQTADSIELSVSKTIDSIEIGGRNYLLNSMDFGSVGTADGITATLNDDGSLTIVSENDNGNWTSLTSLNETANFAKAHLRDGETITISVTMSSPDSTIIPKIYIKEGMGYYQMNGELSSNYSQVYYTTEWKSNDNNVRIHLGFGDAIGTYNIKNIKLEKGNKVTDWTPAPEDMATNEQLKNYSTTEEMHSAINQKADSITLSVSQTYYTKDETQGLIDDIEIGGRNLAEETNQGCKNWIWSLAQAGSYTREDYFDNNVNCCKLTKDEVANTGYSVILYSNIGRSKYEAGQTYTVSFDVLSNVSTNMHASLRKTNYQDPLEVECTPSYCRITENQWSKMVYVMKLNSTLPTTTDQGLYLQGMNSMPGTYYIFKNLKIEKGNLTTADWAPAPEDMATKAELKVTADQMVARVYDGQTGDNCSWIIEPSQFSVSAVANGDGGGITVDASGLTVNGTIHANGGSIGNIHLIEKGKEQYTSAINNELVDVVMRSGDASFSRDFYYGEDEKYPINIDDQGCADIERMLITSTSGTLSNVGITVDGLIYAESFSGDGYICDAVPRTEIVNKDGLKHLYIVFGEGFENGDYSESTVYICGGFSVSWTDSNEHDYQLLADGSLYANAANISGTINATSGTIGGWKIDSGDLCSDSNDNQNHPNIYLSPDGRAMTISELSSTQRNWVMRVKDQFGITDEGQVYSTLIYVNSASNYRNLVMTRGLEITGITMGVGACYITNHGLYTVNATDLNAFAIPNNMVFGALKGGTSPSSVGSSDVIGMAISTSGNITIGNNYDTSKVNSLNGTWKLNNSAGITSDRNLKHDIACLDDKYSVLFDDLKPVKFKYNDGTSNRYHTGFIAQDVCDSVAKAELTTKDFAAYVESTNADDNSVIECGLRYDEFISLNTWQIQKLKIRVKELEDIVTELKAKLD